MPALVHSIALACLVLAAPPARGPGRMPEMTPELMGPPVPPELAPPPPSVVVVPARRILVGGGRVLLPEGAYLRRSPGTLLPRFDAAAGRGLSFLPDDFGKDPAVAIPLAPSAMLEDAERLFVAGPLPPEDGGNGIRVELSGEILAFKGRNWVLADAIAPARSAVARPVPGGADIDIAQDEPDEIAAEDAGEDVVGAQAGPDDGASPADVAAGSADTPPGSAAEEIERALRAATGRPARSLDQPRASDQAGTPGAPSGAAATSPRRGAAVVEFPSAERRVVRRRGTVVRDDDTGGWRFVSVTEDGGAPEPTMRLLATTSVEQMERVIRSYDGPVHLLVTGRVLRYRDEHWLRLVAFEVPRTGRNLAPGGVMAPSRQPSP